MSYRAFGYRAGINQPSVGIQFQLQPPPAESLLTAITVLERYLDFLEIDNIHDRSSIVLPELDLLYIKKIFSLFLVLNQHANIPTFGEVLITSLEVSGDGLIDIHAQIPAVDFYIEHEAKNLNTAINIFRVFFDNAQLINDRADLPIELVNFLKSKFSAPIGADISTIPILRQAFLQRIPFRHIGYGIYQLGFCSARRFISSSSLDSDSAIGAMVTNRKDMTCALLKLAGLPVPHHILVSDISGAQSAVENIGFPVVVKPADKERSEGVSINVINNDMLTLAFDRARALSTNVLIEKNVLGKSYRLMVAAGKFLYAVERHPVSLVGDGVLTIKELWLKQSLLHYPNKLLNRYPFPDLNKETLGILNAYGFSLDTILKLGELAPLREIGSFEWGEQTIDVTHLVSPANIKAAEAAARVLGLLNAGIDLISTDIEKPWWETNAVINEVNFKPHFGGTSAAKQRMGQFLDSLFPQSPRVPVELYIGDNHALEKAIERYTETQEQSLRFCLITEDTVVFDGEEVDFNFPKKGLYQKCISLLMDDRIDGLILAIQTDEFVTTGLPFDRISSIISVNKNLVSFNEKVPISPSALKNLHLLLVSHHI